MFDWSRYRGPLLLALGVLAALAFIDLTLTAVVGLAPRWLHPEIRLALYADIGEPGSRAAGVVAERSRRSPDPAERLGVILGTSGTQYALDPPVLEQRLGPSFRWLSLFNNGGGVNKIADLAGLLAGLEPAPTWVVIGFNQGMMADTVDVVRPFDPARARRSLASGQIRAAYQALKAPLQSRIWLLSNRYRVDRSVRLALYEFQTGLLRWFGEKIDVQFPPHPDPWTVGRPPFHGLTVAEQLELWRGWGWGEAPNYSVDGTQALALIRAVRTCRALGARVIVMELPERSTLRSLVPPEAEEKLKTILNTACDADAPCLLDMRAAVADDLFMDNNHLTPEGRAHFSRLFADEIAPLVGPRVSSARRG